MQTQTGNGRAKEDLENLRFTLVEVEETMERKSQRSSKVLTKIKVVASTLESLIEAFGRDESTKSKKLFEKLYHLIEKASQIAVIKNTAEFRQLKSVDEDDNLESLNQFIYESQKENQELKKEIASFKNQSLKEITKNKEIISQYKSSVARLKNNTQLIRDKLKDVQNIRLTEKDQYKKKIAMLEENNKKLSDQNETLKNLNKRLNTQLEESERQNNENIFKIKKLASAAVPNTARKTENNLTTRSGLETEYRDPEDYLPPRDDGQQKFFKYLEETGRKQRRTVHDSPSQNGFSPSKEIVSSRHSTHQKVKSYRPSSAQKTFENESSILPQTRHSFSARKVTTESQKTPVRKSVGWELGENGNDFEDVEIAPSYRKDLSKDNTPLKDESPSFRDYLKADFDDEAKPVLGQTKDLKEEIFSLDNEIEEIQKLIRDELEN